MKKISRIALKKYGFVWAIMAFPIVNFIVFWLIANFGSLVLAFHSRDFMGKMTGWVGLENFKRFLDDVVNSPVISTAFKNTFLMAGNQFLIIMPLQLFFSYFLFRKFPFHGVVKFILMLPAIISGFVVCLVFKKFVEGALPSIMLELFGIKNFPNLITDVRYGFKTILFYEIWLSFTTTLIMYTNAMNQIDDSILESARLDGINEGLQEFFAICLPLIFPTITTFLVVNFSGFLSASGSLVAFFRFNAPQQYQTFGYWMYVNVAATSSQIMYPYMAASGMFLTVIMAPLTFLLKHLLEKYGPSADY